VFPFPGSSHLGTVIGNIWWNRWKSTDESRLLYLPWYLLHLLSIKLNCGGHCPYYLHQKLLNDASVELTARCSICRIGNDIASNILKWKRYLKVIWHDGHGIIDILTRSDIRGRRSGKGALYTIRYVVKIFTIVSMFVSFACLRTEYSSENFTMTGDLLFRHFDILRAGLTELIIEDHRQSP